MIYLGKREPTLLIEVQVSTTLKGESTAPDGGVNRVFVVMEWAAEMSRRQLGVGLSQLIIGHGPDVFHRAAGAQEQARGRQSNKRN